MSKLATYIRYHVQSKGINFVESTDPTTDVNPEIEHAIWFNYESGEFFICIDNTPNKNIWRGDKGSLIQPETVYVVDIFEDGSCVALWPMNGSLADLSGLYNGSWWRNKVARFIPGKFDKAVSPYRNAQAILPTPFNKDTTIATVSFWFKWNGRNSQMPIGWYRYDIYIYSGSLGFNTGNGDIYGIDFRPYKNKWTHIVAEFHKGEYGKLWINGEPVTLTQRRGKIYTPNAVLDKNLRVFGWGSSTSYRNPGPVDQVRLFNRALTDEEVLRLYHEVGGTK